MGARGGNKPRRKDKQPSTVREALREARLKSESIQEA